MICSSSSDSLGALRVDNFHWKTVKTDGIYYERGMCNDDTEQLQSHISEAP